MSKTKISPLLEGSVSGKGRGKHAGRAGSLSMMIMKDRMVTVLILKCEMQTAGTLQRMESVHEDLLLTLSQRKPGPAYCHCL